MTKIKNIDWKRLFKRIHLNRALCILVFFTFIHTEFLSYHLLPVFSWPHVPKSDPSTSIRLLLVADPQLPGYWNQPSSVLGSLSRHDSDSYISRTYNQALHYAKPDIVVFLGDLIDEGSVAGEQEFKDYVKRFYRIFDIKNNHDTIHHIFVPGDNDIGGEGWDRVTPEKVERFEWAFHAPIEDEEIFKFITFDRANIMPGAKSQLKHAESQHRGGSYKQTLKVLLSHIPMTDIPTGHGDGIIQKFKPNIIFSGHEHKSVFVRNGQQQIFANQKGFVNLNIMDATTLKEIIVPSCNYKLGNTGYGTAIINQNGDMFYAVLWLPPRYKVLCLYLLLIPVVIGLVAIDKAFKHQNLISWCMEGAKELSEKAMSGSGEKSTKSKSKSKTKSKDSNFNFIFPDRKSSKKSKD